jgi:hypothetical protein
LLSRSTGTSCNKGCPAAFDTEVTLTMPLRPVFYKQKPSGRDVEKKDN